MIGHGEPGYFGGAKAIGAHMGFDLVRQGRAAAAGDRTVGLHHIFVKATKFDLIGTQLGVHGAGFCGKSSSAQKGDGKKLVHVGTP